MNEITEEGSYKVLECVSILIFRPSQRLVLLSNLRSLLTPRNHITLGSSRLHPIIRILTVHALKESSRVVGWCGGGKRTASRLQARPGGCAAPQGKRPLSTRIRPRRAIQSHRSPPIPLLTNDGHLCYSCDSFSSL